MGSRRKKIRFRIGTRDGKASLELGDARTVRASLWKAARDAGFDSGNVAAPVFISYARPNRRCYVEPLVEYLRDQGFTAWADWSDIPVGTAFEGEIDQGIHTCTAMIAVLTPTSVDPDRWVQKEWERALKTYFVPVLPIKVEKCEYPEILKPIQYLDTAPTPKKKGVADFDPSDLERLKESLEEAVLPGGEWLTDETPPVGRVFVGRDKELCDLVSKLSYGVRLGLSKKANNAPVVVEGLGGMGKTMLVSELVRRIGPRFPGGVIFHSRTERKDPRQVMRDWAQLLERKKKKQLPADFTPEQSRDALAAVGQLLVVIDDVWEEDFENVRLLCNDALPEGTERILTTRDKKLSSVVGGNPLRLVRLKLRDGIALLEDRLGEAGTVPVRAALHRLWRVLGGHALALEVAAGRCVNNPAFLDQQTSVLENQIQTGQLSNVALRMREATRNDSLLFCFDMSLEEVRAADRSGGTHLADRFAHLGVLAEEAPFDPSTAAAIWRTEPGDAVDSLLALSELGLVTSISDTMTFKLHPLLHAYALGLLKETPRKLKSAETRHVRHYVERLGEFQDDRWREFEDHAPNVALAGERASSWLPEELIQSLGGPERAKAEVRYNRVAARRVMELALAAAHYVWHRRIHSGKHWLGAGLAAARLLREPLPQARLLTHLGVWHNERGERKVARAFLEPALKIWRRYAATREGRCGLAWALNMLGVVHRAIDEPLVAARYYREAIPIQEALGRVKGLAISLGCIGVLYRDAGQHDKALEYYERSLAIEHERDDLNGQSIVINNMGRAYRDLGRTAEALEHFEGALELAWLAGNEAGTAIVLNNLGNVYFDRGVFDRALEHFRQTVPIREAVEDWARLAVSFHNIGEALHAQKHDTEALGFFDRALAVEEQVDDVAGRASTLYSEAVVLFEAGRGKDYAAALVRLEQSRQILEEKKLERTSAGVPLTEIRRLENDWRAHRATAPLAAGTI